VDGGSQLTAANDPETSIEPVELKRALDGGKRIVVLDVSEREDYAQEHIVGARNIPFDELDVRAGNELSDSDLIVIYCKCADDESSKMASESLRRQSFRQAVVLNGGLDAWRQSGLPTASQ
jgi:rhodanese-related sulfurtransferase